MSQDPDSLVLMRILRYSLQITSGDSFFHSLDVGHFLLLSTISYPARFCMNHFSACRCSLGMDAQLSWMASLKLPMLQTR